MGITDAEAFRPALEAVLRAHASQPVDLLIVGAIPEWCAERNSTCSGDPAAMAITDGATGQWGVLLRRAIDASAVGSILDRMEFGGGFGQCREILDTPEQFLKHTVLHELAHLANGWGQERENDCDRWAFERLSETAI